MDTFKGLLPSGDCIEATRKLKALEAAASDGQPVYAEMAARIEARRIERAQALLRAALKKGAQG